MNQAGEETRNFAYNNQNAAYPQYGMPMAPYPQYQGGMPPYPQYQGGVQVAPYGTAQQGYPSFPPPRPGTNFENSSGNPCKCCCGVVTAAKTLSVLNLLYLLVEIIDLIPSLHFYSFQDMGYFYSCMNYETTKYPESTGSSLYHPALILFVVSKLAYFVATIGFIHVVFGSPGTKIELLWSKVFMLISFGYAGTFLLARTLSIFAACQAFYWFHEHLNPMKLLITTIWIITLSIFNGLVGRGFKNMVQQRRMAAPQLQQGVVGDVPGNSTMFVEESIPYQAGEVPEIEQP